MGDKSSGVLHVFYKFLLILINSFNTFRSLLHTQKLISYLFSVFPISNWNRFMSPCFTEVKSGLSPVASTSIWYDDVRYQEEERRGAVD